MNKRVLKLINSEAGRVLIGHKQDFSITRVTPNSYHYQIDSRTYVGVFFSSNRIKNIFSPIFTKMAIATDAGYRYSYSAFLHFAGLEHSHFLPNILLSSRTFNPNTGEQTGRYNNAAGFSTARDAASSNANSSGTEIGCSFTGGGYYVYRPFEPFNTSSLGSGSVVSAVVKPTIQIYRDDSLEFGGNGFKNADTTNINVVTTAQASPTSYASSDFSTVSFSSKGSLNFGSTSDVTYNTITFTDETIISKTANTLIALIAGRDLANSAPTGENWLAFQPRGAANPPILTVTYTPPANILMGGEI